MVGPHTVKVMTFGILLMTHRLSDNEPDDDNFELDKEDEEDINEDTESQEEELEDDDLIDDLIDLDDEYDDFEERVGDLRRDEVSE